jgi:hypothetical protein
MSPWIPIVIFAIAAVIGLTMALDVFKGQFPKVPSAVLHGIFAASGLVLLLLAVFVHGAGGPVLWALCLFLIAALGGFTLAFGFHARKKPLPGGVVVVHAAVAVIGFLLLLVAALKLM